MSMCDSHNATPPSPAIAPGADGIDVRRVAARFGERGVDPRLAALLPAFDAPFFQAGLCGYSDAAMRIVARRHGCPFCVTEALLDRSILAGGRGFAKADLGELEDNVPGGEEDHPLAGQIMGSEPAEMAAAALKMIEQRARADREYRELAYARAGSFEARVHHRGTETQREEQGVENPSVSLSPDDDRRLHPLAPPEGSRHACQGSSGTCLPDSALLSVPLSLSGESPRESTFEVIDVNLACPVKKIQARARGGHWLAEPDGAIAILEAVREALPANVITTVKMRRSFDDTPEMAENFERIFDAAYDMGYAWVTVHGRTVKQKYIGPSRWDILRDIVRRNPDRLIFGSGDVWDASDIFRMVEYTGVAAASVARGCIGNPWIFRQARDMMAGRPPRPPTVAEQREVLEDHFALALAVNGKSRKGEEFTGRSMRKFGIKFAAHHPRGEEVKKRMIGIKGQDDWRSIIDQFYTDGELVPA